MDPCDTIYSVLRFRLNRFASLNRFPQLTESHVYRISEFDVMIFFLIFKLFIIHFPQIYAEKPNSSRTKANFCWVNKNITVYFFNRFFHLIFRLWNLGFSVFFVETWSILDDETRKSLKNYIWNKIQVPERVIEARISGHLMESWKISGF